MMRYSAFAALAAALFCLSATPASAQATRTWVSAVGDDVNPCSRTAPCKTFAGAISKTATRGEINCLDNGEFGPVTITKSIAIVCEAAYAGIDVTSGAAITVTAGNVILRGLTLTGLGLGSFGVNVSGAANVTIENCSFDRFAGAGIRFGAPGSLLVSDSSISNGGYGVVVDGSAGSAMMTLRDTVISKQSNDGIAVVTSGPRAQAMIDGASIVFSGGSGVVVNGGAAVVMLGNSTIVGNAVGVTLAAGSLTSFRTNQIGSNGADGTPIDGAANANAVAGTHDFNRDGYSDILWRDSAGNLRL